MPRGSEGAAIILTGRGRQVRRRTETRSGFRDTEVTSNFVKNYFGGVEMAPARLEGVKE